MTPSIAGGQPLSSARPTGNGPSASPGFRCRARQGATFCHALLYALRLALRRANA